MAVVDDPQESDSPPDPERTHTHEASGAPPGRIGRYRLLEKIGEGGMGEVFLAEQQEPVRRRVAVKIIKHGMDTRRVVARFESERQALAMMDHSCIAKVLDAGATDGGRPYFVMEHVPGLRITHHCDKHRLTTRERLRLFTRVCDGVQHAHHKAIIHRDIKASNILVSVQDGTAVPKIIDFGVAKAVAQRLTERTLHTELGQIIGTPEYMSPEQAELTREDVDTRTDVYSLGVVLYELLVGALPFDAKELRRVGFDEIRRRIREEEPQKPSTRLSTLGDGSGEVARRRRADPPTLRRQLRGDLDRIVMKALEKDRTRRYSSPLELAADIERYLRHEPVIAAPPSTWYRAGKFVRRHRWGVAFATTVGILLAASAIGWGLQANRIARERDRANREAETARQTAEFLTGLFEVSDPSESRGNTVTAREILDRGAERIETELRDRPLVQTRLMHTIGNVYEALGLYGEAEPLLDESRARYRELLGNDDRETLVAGTHVASVYLEQGRYEEAAALLAETLEAERRVLGPRDPETLQTMDQLGVTYAHLARFDEAEQLHLEAAEGLRKVLGDDHRITIGRLTNLAALYLQRGRYDEAISLLEEVLAARERNLGSNHPRTLVVMNDLASAYGEVGRFEEAERTYLETLAACRRVLGDEHSQTLKVMNNLASVYKELGRYDEAERLFRETVAIRRRTLGDEHPDTLGAMANLGVVLRKLERPEEAREILEQTLELRRRVLGPDHPRTLTNMVHLASVLYTLERFDRNEALLLEALEGQRRTLGPEHRATLMTQNNLVVLYRTLGRLDEAERLAVATLETQRRVLGGDHPDTIRSLYNLSLVHRERGDYATSERYLLEVIEARKRVLGETHPTTLATVYRRAVLLELRGERARALAVLRGLVEQGWAKSIVFEDTKMESLREDPGFEPIAAEIRKRLERS
jgi:non-specific serine/threonine protein kinase/serine/threonine-protein kinase